jgi:hypothetical protein
MRSPRMHTATAVRIRKVAQLCFEFAISFSPTTGEDIPKKEMENI